MPLNLNDLMKKAKDKGIVKDNAPSSSPFLRTWQQESVLYQNSDQGTSREQQENNQGTTREQPENHQRSSREPRENHKGTTREQIREQPENELGNKLENIPGNKLGNSIQEKIWITLTHLSGLQKKLFNYTLEICLSKDSSCTGFISTFEMAKTIGSSYESAKVTLKRLIKKELIIRLKGKACKGGFINLEIPREIKLIALDIKKLNGPGNKLGNNLENELENNPGNNSTSSNNSLDLDNKTIITEVSDEWNFDITPYAAFGFRKSHLKQLINDKKLTPSQVEESLAHFSYDYENGFLKKEIYSKIGWLMKILRGGNEFVSDKYNDLLQAESRANVDRVLKRKNERLEYEFILWEDSLSDEERKAIENKLPTHLLVLYRAHGIANLEVRNWFFNYYVTIAK